MSSIVLSCQNVHKVFRDAGDDLAVLKGIDLNVAENQTVAILGVSGSGKSTLLHLLGGLDRVTEGEICWHGQPIQKLSEKARCCMRNKHLGFIYQFHHLLPEFTAVENVAMSLLIQGINATEARLIAEDFLSKVGLQDRTHHKPGELSGGERQRIAIARALVTRPACVLADEPTGNLDQQNAKQSFQIMLELQRNLGTSFVIVTHDTQLAAQAKMIFVLENGKLRRK